MYGRLYGRGALFDVEPAGLVPRLVGIRPYELHAQRPEHPSGPPLLVLAGGRGAGKSAVLGELWEAYTGHNRRGEARRRTPVALVDCEDEQFAGPPHEESPESWSPVWQALLVIAEQLTEPVKAAGQLTFPRLTAGLVAVRASDWSGRTDSDRIRRELVRILLLNERATRFTMAGRWAAKVASKVIAAASSDDPFVAATVEATLEALSEGVTHRKEQRPATWYRAYPNAGGNAKRGLLLLAGNFRAGGTSREHAERWLVRALLADLADAYSGIGSHLTRLGRPLVLLDNARRGPGPGLLDAVLRDRADGVTDQVIWVATVRGTNHPALGDAVRRELPDVARTTDWEPGTSPSSRALLVPLPPLSPDDTLHMVGAVCYDTEVPPQLPHATHRLTGGNPLGIVLLATAARQHPDRAASLGRLLIAKVKLEEGQADDGRPTYAELLRRLVPADRLDELTVLAAAHDHDSAVALAHAGLPDDFGASGVRSLRARLAEEGLTAEPGQFVGDPFVRTLLLLRLHHRHPDHAKWREVHETMIAHFAAGPGARTPSPGADAFRLYHELALGDTAGAVAHLRDTFTVLRTRTWLDTLRFLASAPYFHAHDAEGRDFDGHDDRRTAVALGRTDAAQQPPDGVNTALHLRIRRLLHAVWQVTDPLVLPDPKVCGRLEFELLQLSDLRPAGGALLFAASQSWPRDARAGRPLRTPTEEGDTDGDDGDGNRPGDGDDDGDGVA
ncbi:hypothetical protein SAMN04487983_104925 [Streptomyces sp. yr375]|uniref:hypothetical protein n=1 Tax=Streptomyces sp. yr375 TaxID=1761906 RepID=UPI0008D6C866|nr:hypothetical protein [Streptomyces sp. yr375]SES40252.1 hypothetical protein SAMN04487983_104925 [Streptomyces sp. yr375]